MKDWVKIQSFERLHQAELRKDILEKNGIQSVIINEKDSLFLLGEIELYVSEENEKKAKVLIDEFEGLTKINSFTELKPILLFQKLLQDSGIETILKKKEDSRFVLDNYELYVNNIQIEAVIPFLKGEKLVGWKKIETQRTVRQTKHKVDLLSENMIESIIIKKKDSNYHLEEIAIFVQNEDFERASKILTVLLGWIKVKSSENFSEIEKQEASLANAGIKSLICRQENNIIDLYVEASEEEKAIDVLNITTEWTCIFTIDSIVKAVFYKELLDVNEIQSVIINEKDSSFVLGEIELHVETANVEKAFKIIKESENTIIPETSEE